VQCTTAATPNSSIHKRLIKVMQSTSPGMHQQALVTEPQMLERETEALFKAQTAAADALAPSRRRLQGARLADNGMTSHAIRHAARSRPVHTDDITQCTSAATNNLRNSPTRAHFHCQHHHQALQLMLLVSFASSQPRQHFSAVHAAAANKCTQNAQLARGHECPSPPS
jgi:hypothetical protein